MVVKRRPGSIEILRGEMRFYDRNDQEDNAPEGLRFHRAG